jgi:Streptomyces sporulation and cell division protein, SsgA
VSRLNTSDRTVCAELEIALVAPDDVMVPLIVSLYYSPRDPYAVRMAFHVGTDEPNEWTFARDLLAEGLQTCAGVGDVQMWPSSSETAADSILNLQLVSPTGSARIQVPAAEVATFLGRTYRLVQLGEESSAIDIDAELSFLLRD